MIPVKRSIQTQKSGSRKVEMQNYVIRSDTRQISGPAISSSIVLFC